MSLYSRISDLRFEISSLSLVGLSQSTRQFLRRTTLIELRGLDEQGVGEDVNYSSEEQLAFQAFGKGLPLKGTYTLAEFSAYLDTLDLFPKTPAQSAAIHYRRWAFESAALDLALRQNQTTLPSAISSSKDAPEFESQPTRFVVSMGLGSPPSSDPLRDLWSIEPSLRFKLDANPAWSKDFIRELIEMDFVDVVDFKGAYRGTIVDQPGNPGLYRQVAEGFPHAWLEDPDMNSETEAALLDFKDRVTWDAPIHSVADIERCPWEPRAINIKPSRFGTLKELFEAYEYCQRQGIFMYGGGQFELGVGRHQIQYLASLFHPDAPNDVAPSVYNQEKWPKQLPKSPLTLPICAKGFTLA